MKKELYDKHGIDNAWCPGCGNFGLRNIVMEAYAELGINKKDLVMVSGIGQAAKSPQYYDVSYFNGLHGRALPVASGIKAAQPALTVVVQSGDGDLYGEGGNHLVHAIRRNPDITVIVHDNMIYGLTKGQAAPTSQKGHKTPIQTEGVFEEPINPIALAISLDASFVARGSVGEKELTRELIKQAIAHKGFSIVDVFQACVSFNKINTHRWFKENTYILEEGRKLDNRTEAIARAFESSPWPLGLFYQNSAKETFEENLVPYKSGDTTPLYARNRGDDVPKKMMQALTVS